MNKKNLNKLLALLLLFSLILCSCSSKKVNASIGNSKNQVDVSQDNSNRIETYFTRKDGNLDKKLIKEINSAEKEIDIAIYSFTKTDIAKAIMDAKKRNVNIRIVSDKENSNSKYQKALLDNFKKNNIPVKINSHAGLIMHLKLTIIDNKTVVGGSYNYTEQATTNNDENLIIMRDTDIVNDYLTEYNRIWNDTTNYSDY